MMNSVTVSAELGLSLVVPEHGAVPLVASLDYCADDPYAIKMAFHVGADEPVEWIFGRELLASGLEGPVGEGDVQVWPDDADGADTLNLALSSPFGEAHFEAPLSELAEFLKSSYGIVPAGAESDFIDVDSELDELLWQA
jgi:Streptomyces sporulation and cell division protein, SsgA